MQHKPSLSSNGTEVANAESSLERRGMHCASGAYWNSEKDGMWNFKYDKAETKGFDVIVSVIWISVA